MQIFNSTYSDYFGDLNRDCQILGAGNIVTIYF